MKKTIEIPEGHELIQEGNTYKIVKKKDKYPMTLRWALATVDMLDMPQHSSLAEKYRTFIRLVETCKAWNKIDGFEADWVDDYKDKHCIITFEDITSLDYKRYTSCPLHFKDKETAELFLNTFREEIELVKDLI